MRWRLAVRCTLYCRLFRTLSIDEATTMDADFWDEIERNRHIPGAQKMTESLQLFDQAARRMLAGIKAQFPGISEEDAIKIRAERLEIIRKLEEIK